jgi:hypothetical protein
MLERSFSWQITEPALKYAAIIAPTISCFLRLIARLFEISKQSERAVQKLRFSVHQIEVRHTPQVLKPYKLSAIPLASASPPVQAPKHSPSPSLLQTKCMEKGERSGKQQGNSGMNKQRETAGNSGKQQNE